MDMAGAAASQAARISLTPPSRLPDDESLALGVDVLDKSDAVSRRRELSHVAPRLEHSLPALGRAGVRDGSGD